MEDKELEDKSQLFIRLITREEQTHVEDLSPAGGVAGASASAWDEPLPAPRR